MTGFSQQTTGFSLSVGRHLGKWSRAFLNYAYEIIEIGEVDTSNEPFYPGYGSGRGCLRPAV